MESACAREGYREEEAGGEMRGTAGVEVQVTLLLVVEIDGGWLWRDLGGALSSELALQS